MLLTKRTEFNVNLASCPITNYMCENGQIQITGIATIWCQTVRDRWTRAFFLTSTSMNSLKRTANYSSQFKSKARIDHRQPMFVRLSVCPPPWHTLFALTFFPEEPRPDPWDEALWVLLLKIVILDTVWDSREHFIQMWSFQVIFSIGALCNVVVNEIAKVFVCISSFVRYLTKTLTEIVEVMVPIPKKLCLGA